MRLQVETETGMSDIVRKVVDLLKDTRGLEAIVLGGSRARGTHGPDSDFDIGLYYDKDNIDFSLLEAKAQELDQEHRENLLARPGEWGKWQNGGCWITIDDLPVDFIMRDVCRVQAAIQECQEGIVTPHYQTGHPHAYLNVMYMGELAVCKLLWHRDDEIRELKRFAEEYPPRMKAEIIHLFSFETGFSLMLAEKNIPRDDSYYVVAHLVRSVSALNQVLFALNEQYCINEKKAVKMIDAFAIRPDNYKNRIDMIFALAGTDPAKSCNLVKELMADANNLLNLHYSS